MIRFEVGKEYTGKTIFNEHKMTCVRRTAKTVTFLWDGDEYTKRIKTTSSGEYVVFDADLMGYVDMELKAYTEE